MRLLPPADVFSAAFVATRGIIKYDTVMISKNTLVLYKKQPAVVSDTEGDKYIIRFCTAPASPGGKKAVFGTQKVRGKDIAPLTSVPVSSLEAVLAAAGDAGRFSAQITEAWELLLSDDDTAASALPFSELCGLIDAELSPESAWALYAALTGGFEFESKEPAADGAEPLFVPRSAEAVAALKQKADEKEHAAEIRDAFIRRLKNRSLDMPADSRFMSEIEALALGQNDKSKAMHDAGYAETPEKAHKLLLDTGVWAVTRNPHPTRWGLSMHSASEGLAAPPDEERYKVPGVSYAIDNAWSSDPDDAVAWDGEHLWVHIADPASTVMPGSSIDNTARARGATLYIPEGASRMLCEDALSDYALGLNPESRALSFRLTFAEDGAVEECTVLKTLVTVQRLTYEQADAQKDSPELKPLFDIARRNIERRRKAGAVFIDLPEVHITVEPETKKVSIVPASHPESADMVREMMLLAGEGAARFAFLKNLAFAYVGQDAPEIPDDIPDGLAGQYRLRRCMRRRSVGIAPKAHAGLGLSVYSQVTSPLRRYSDLVSHEQLRAFLDGRRPLDKNTMLERISAGDEAAYACKKAERNSNQHWTLVYLLQNPDWTGEAVCVEQKGKQAVFLIPSIGQETLITPDHQVELNQTITVRAGNIDIPNLSVTFIPV